MLDQQETRIAVSRYVMARHDSRLDGHIVWCSGPIIQVQFIGRDQTRWFTQKEFNETYF
jgi:hypothetical protein